MGNILVFAEQEKGKFPKSTLIAIQAGKEAASKLGGDCYAAILGSGIEALAKELTEYGITKVLMVEGPSFEHYLADAYAAALEQLIKANEVSLLLGTVTAIGKDLLPRVAARLGVSMASDVVAIESDGTFIRPMYAGNVMAWLIEAKIRGDDPRKGKPYSLQPTIYLSYDLNGFLICRDFDLRGKRRLNVACGQPKSAASICPA